VFGISSLVTSAHRKESSIAKSTGHLNKSLLDISKPENGCCAIAAAKAPQFKAINAPEYETYKLTATYFRVREGWTTTLMFNNKGAEPIVATLTIYSMAGTRFNPTPITVPAASYIEVNMRDVLAAASEEFSEGSMKMAYTGIETQLGAQVKMVDAENSLIWAEQFVYTSKAKSSRLESVWWLPFPNSDTSVAVSNTSGGTVSVTMTVDGTSPQQSSP